MLLAQSGNMSSGKNARHINIRYYFITDHIAGRNMSLVYCPTDIMVADYFNKAITRHEVLKVLHHDHESP